MAKRKPAPPAETEAAPASSNYTVLARRYRPQQFAELIGQEHVAQGLKNALQSGRVAHAYLFTGARGVGKTSCARILAKALNCVQGPTVTPCDACDMCRAIMSGDDVDVIEIDGASNRRIEEVREIRQNVQFRPSRSRYKIYIVDEVHMLTREAFNALLKTLEEPPGHVKFIFATTEVERIPITILSRCQRFDFAGISVKNITAHLKIIVASERMQADDAALELVARRARGSMRDAESLLDQLLAFGGDRLTTDQVHRMLGTANDQRVTALAEAVLGQQAGQVLQILGAAADEGLDLGELLGQLIDYWRDLMVVHCAGLEGQALSVGSAEQPALERQAKQVSLDSILAGLEILAATKNRLKFNTQHGRILVEAALLRLTQLGQLTSLAQLAESLRQPSISPATGTAPSARPATGAPPPRALAAILPADVKKKPADSDNAPGVSLQLTPASAGQVWAAILAQQSGFLAADLQKIAAVATSGPNTLVIQFPPGYNLLRDRCQERVGQLEQTLEKVIGHPASIRIEAIVSTSERPAMDSSEGTLSAAGGARRLDSKVGDVPLIKKAREVLGAQILDRNTDPEFGVGTNGEAKVEKE